MPGFLGGSTGGGGAAGGQISFPSEFVDPVTKFRVSNPQNLIDTDFEYGLQPTKWETVELINNTPSFFSKSGDTTIPNIIAITTIQGSREITVTTALEHGLSVGTPINVSGTKSITADGAYIINSVPTDKTFTYLAKENQFFTASIDDLYTAIITGEFFQGSQIRISDSEGLTTDAENPSILTVTTDSPHGFGPNTPFYFLNLNSTISQEFDSTNTEAKTFDSSNNSTARTFDGSNTVQATSYDFTNRVASSPQSVASAISGVNTENNNITVLHAFENFAGKPLGTALYYNVTAPSGYFFDNPRGVVFLRSTNTLGVNSSTFTVSGSPNGDVINIASNLSGSFQLADLVSTFAGNNEDIDNQVSVVLQKGTAYSFDGENSGSETFTISGFSGLGNVTLTQATNWEEGQMVFYSTSGSAAVGLSNNTTFWVTATNPSTTVVTLASEPDGETITSVSGGTGTQTLTSISVSLDKDILAVPGHNFQEADMVLYDYPEDGALGTDEAPSNYYYIDRVYDSTYIRLTTVKGFVLNGTTEARAAVSASRILEAAPNSPDGAYWIKPEGAQNAYLTYCNFSLEGGGWAQMMKLSSNTLLSNAATAGTAPRTGSAFVYAANWDGWGWNSDNQFDTLFTEQNNASFGDVDSFSKLFYQYPFNDVMFVSLNDTTRRMGWRHNATIPNMRAVTGGTNLPTLGDSILFPNVSADEFSLVRRLQVVAGVRDFVSQTGLRYGFKILSDYANNYGTLTSNVLGGYNTEGSDLVTGHGMAMIGMGGTGTASSRFGGGVGFTYTTGARQWKAHGHFYGFGDVSNGFNNRTFTGFAVFVR
jgi:hypothetical protein